MIRVERLDVHYILEGTQVSSQPQDGWQYSHGKRVRRLGGPGSGPSPWCKKCCYEAVPHEEWRELKPAEIAAKYGGSAEQARQYREYNYKPKYSPPALPYEALTDDQWRRWSNPKIAQKLGGNEYAVRKYRIGHGKPKFDQSLWWEEDT